LTLSPNGFNPEKELNEGNVRQWLDGLSQNYRSVEQARWNQSHIDTLFYAGDQSQMNALYGPTGAGNVVKYHFNLCQQPVNMITGYQRQHRKAIVFQNTDSSDDETTDQYTKLMSQVCQLEDIHEIYSRACELASISGKVLLQPYLDYTGEDPLQGQLKVKLWEYNSFLLDPYYRNPDMSDCRFVWTQEYITREEARERFKDKLDKVNMMNSAPSNYGDFYFLPEKNQLDSSFMMVVSYVWYRGSIEKKKLYSKKRNQFFDFAGGDNQLDQILQVIDDFTVVKVKQPCWKLALILNNSLMYHGENPLWNGTECPFVALDWNYDPQISHPELRVRSLIRTMRDPQFLFNYKIITNNDIAAATINAGWKRKEGAVANEESLKKTGQGYDVIINNEYELSDVEKIIPSAVPQSDLALAQQMNDLIFKTAGIDLENWSGQSDQQISSLTLMMKQAANLMVFQKYFDQWDLALKLLGEKLLQIALHNWNAEKVGLLIGEEPSPFFYSKVFAKYKTVVEEGLLTPTQRNLQAQQMMDINQAFGREVIPPSIIIERMNIQGKGKLMEFFKQQEEQQQQAAQEQQQVASAFQMAELQKLQSEATNNIALARERHGRAESNIGLFEERLSEITHNRALATKEKVEALEKLIELVRKYGDYATAENMQRIERYEDANIVDEDKEKIDAKRTSLANEFRNSIMNGSRSPQEEVL
jgi:hypothetical protein